MAAKHNFAVDAAVYRPSRQDCLVMEQRKRKLDSSQGDVPKVSRKDAYSGTFIEVDGTSCLHRVAVPDGHPSVDVTPSFHGPYARSYPFELDPFQKTAIACLEAGDSVLVAAHTSAGKTVIAEYACAMAIRDKTRMIYTSPLKALSNQKYRQLVDDFSDVGLLTGDVSINDDASCLVVTTEVFRSMLYEHSPILQEITSVVFDEVHYMNDKERGVVWEECLIWMPKDACAIFLSATIPNALEFATWFATVHASNCHIISTEHRPVPLQHYIFPTGGDGLYLVMDENGRFLEENFQRACSDISGMPITAQLKTSKGHDFNWDDTSDLFKLMNLLIERGGDPVIVFAFSKRTCECLAFQLTQLDVHGDEEKALIEQIVRNAVDALSEKDRRLPHVQHLLPMLKRGIAVHHSGLLPIVKEIVELLFQEGLVKILYATETFSTGLNMPAKTVVFAGAKKFDDGGFRWMVAGEYIQMSGRAGRRGIDQMGTSIFIMDAAMDASTVRDILRGSPLPLLSAFRISYRMILDNLRMEGGHPEAIVRRSYKQYLCTKSAPSIREKLQKCSMDIEALMMDDVDDTVGQWIEKQKEWHRLENDVTRTVFQPRHCLPFLNPGRLVEVMANNAHTLDDPSTEFLMGRMESCWGSVINFVKKEADETQGVSFLVDILINARSNRDSHEWLPLNDERGSPIVIRFPLTSLRTLSTVCVHLEKNLKSVSGRKTTLNRLRAAVDRLKEKHGTIPRLDPIKHMKIENSSVQIAMTRLKELKRDASIQDIPNLQERIEKSHQYRHLMTQKAILEADLAAAEDMIMKQEFRRMLKMLMRLQCIDPTGIVLQKGQIALNFRTADALMLTEMVFNGYLQSLSPSQVAALVSCLIQSDGKQPQKKISTEMEDVFRLVEKTAMEIGAMAKECKLVTRVEDYVQQFHPCYMSALYAWSTGAPFNEIVKISDIYEGSIVRIVRQVYHVLMELEAALKLTGQQRLQDKVRTAQECIKRDVIFAGSLYL